MKHAPIVIFLTLLAIAAGCTKRMIEIPTKFGPVKYDSSRVGNKESIKEVVFTAPDGSSLTIKGFSGNQVDALEAVAEGTARGTAQGLTGGAGTAGAATKAPVQKMEISEFGAFVPPASGGFFNTPNFPLPGQPVLQWDGKTITTNIYRPLDELRK